MSKTSTTQITVTTTGDGVTSTDSPTAVTSTNCPSGGPLKTSLTSGDNSVTFPSGATGLLLIPPSDSTVDIIFKGVNGDTGVKIYPTKPFLYWFKSGETGIVINVSANLVTSIHWI